MTEICNHCGKTMREASRVEKFLAPLPLGVLQKLPISYPGEVYVHKEKPERGFVSTFQLIGDVPEEVCSQFVLEVDQKRNS